MGFALDFDIRNDPAEDFNMPQPIHFRENASGFRSFPKVVLERPDLAALLGAIAAEWGYIDRALVSIYEIALGDHEPFGHGVNAVHQEVFETLIAINTRLEIISRVLKARVPEPVPSRFSDLCIVLRARAGERARYVHANWSISEDFPDDLIVTGRDGNFRYQRHDFEQVLERTVDIRTKIHGFIIEVAHAPRLEP